MSTKKLIFIALIGGCLIKFAVAQDASSSGTLNSDNSNLILNKERSKNLNEIRGKNSLTLTGGTSVMNGDLVDPMFEIYYHAGYKRFLGSHINININFHKFNLAYKDAFNEGFMSFDINLEAYLAPFNAFTPFIYAGGGLNAANYFTQTDPKVQGGGGIEYLFTNNIAVKLFTDYNYVFSDELDGLVAGDSEDIYWRIGLGLNLYFGNRGRSNRIIKNMPTVIESNPIVDY